jgi:hypothetical protein
MMICQSSNHICCLPRMKKTERNRRLGVVLCERKRDQKRVKNDALEEECTELKGKSKDLLQENSGLEDLVRTAGAMVDRAEDKQGDPTSVQVDTSSPSWSSAELSDSRDSISTAVQDWLGLSSSAGEVTGALKICHSGRNFVTNLEQCRIF